VKPHNTNATAWYEGQYHVDVWFPFLQYEGSCKLQDFRCIHCKRTSLESKDYDYRPMFSFDKVSYCYHRRLRCTNSDCRKTFVEIDPRFLPQFPTVILDRFKFLTTIKGYGVDIMLLYHFANLHCTGTAPGRYVKSLNEMLKLKYHMDWATYMDSLSAFSQHQESFGLDATILQPFKPFHSPGFYNGILLPRSLFKKCWLVFASAKEPRLQAGFQMCIDEGIAADHCHKFPTRIHMNGRAGKSFEASYSAQAMNGQMNFSRMNSGKSNDEVESIVQEYREARLKAGFEELKTFCGDGGPDQAVWKKKSSEIETGIKPYPVPEKVSAESEVLSPYCITNLKPDDLVMYYINGVDCALCTIVHVGDNLEKRPYGALKNIPPGKVLVRLTSVIRCNIRPMESFTLTKEEKNRGELSGWNYPKTTLQKIWSLWKE
jgi:hypothetical protein